MIMKTEKQISFTSLSRLIYICYFDQMWLASVMTYLVAKTAHKRKQRRLSGKTTQE